jgi:hypothetical protein
MNKNNNFTPEEKEWYKKEQLKDEIFVLKYKEDIISEIKKTKKEEIIVIKKLSLWQKLKKMLGF